MLPLFSPYVIAPSQITQLHEQGHLLLPGLLTLPAREALVAALGRIAALHEAYGPELPGDRLPGKYAAEHDSWLARLPRMTGG